MNDHGAATIKAWMQDLIENAQLESELETSAGAESGRSYAYLEFHRPDGRHSVLVFALDHGEDPPVMRAHRFDGSADDVRRHIEQLVPDEDRPVR